MKFDPIFSVWTITIIVLPLFAFFLLNEFRRQQKFLWFRVVAQIIMLVAILGFLLQPVYRHKPGSQKILLLTPGYDPLKVDSLVKATPTITVLAINEAPPYPQARSLQSFHDLEECVGDIDIIIGEGLPYYALGLMAQKRFTFIPGHIPSGLTQVFIPTNIQANQKSLIQGTFNATTQSKLKLIGPGGIEDSTVLEKGQNFFSLSFRPKQPGLYVFNILATEGPSTEFTEKLPIEVLRERKLHILFLQKFPTAEVRYLKNYLAEKGHALALRYQTSKSNFRYEYANQDPVKLDYITPQLTNIFDLVFVDSNVLEEMTIVEINALKKSIRAGLGVIILMNRLPEKNKRFVDFLPSDFKQSKEDTARVYFARSKHYTFPVIPLKISSSPAIQIITQANGRILSGYSHHGFGKIGFQLLQETYRISLQGDSDDYAYLWAPLIEKTARAENESFKLKLKNLLPFYPNEPLFLEVISSGTHPAVYADSVQLALTEDVILDDLWHGVGWAGKPGWHQFSINADSSIFNYFVSDTSDLKALRKTHQQKGNELAASPNPVAVHYHEKINLTPVPALLFYLMFLIAAGFLWLAPKI